LVEPLTDRNGVVCRHCNSTIDLTGKHPYHVSKALISERRIFQRIERAMNAFSASSYYFYIKCDHCGRETRYEFDDIKPIAPNVEELKMRIATLENEKKQAKLDAKTLARELLADELKAVGPVHSHPETDDLETTVPPNAKEPKMEKDKKKDERPAYLA